jgi:hypothetical protein
LQLINPSTSPNELNRTLTPHSIIHGDACFAYFNKIWGIPQPDWERPKFSFGKSTPEQAKAALEAYSAYFGTYFVDEQAATVTHRRTGNINPGDMGDFVRKVEFRDSRLILRSETNNVITWERVTQ